MSRVEEYRTKLRTITEWHSFLLSESGLPGPRGNIELAQAVAEEGDEARFDKMLEFDSERAPANTPGEFLAFCGALGLGRLLAEGRRDLMQRLRALASDPRWRMREAVAMALQRFGKAHIEELLQEMSEWGRGNHLEQRASAAALCEPVLLADPQVTVKVLEHLDRLTASIEGTSDRKSLEFNAFRKAMGYCWSVAVAAGPDPGRPMMQKWFSNPDPDVRWIMRENLRKNRLERVMPEWVGTWRRELGVD
jgi:hypothetical protein